MARISKYRVGQKVKGIHNKDVTYDVLEVNKNNLVVRYDNETFNLPKKLFEVVQ